MVYQGSFFQQQWIDDFGAKVKVKTSFFFMSVHNIL